MFSLKQRNKRIPMVALLALGAGQLAGCSRGTSGGNTTGGTSAMGGHGGTGGTSAAGGASSKGGTTSNGGTATNSGGTLAAGGSPNSGGVVAAGGTSASGGSPSSGGAIATGGKSASGGATGSGGDSGQYVVAIVQSSKAQASDITQDDVKTLVGDAITRAGGLDFIHNGQTVVLKPNIVTPYADMFGTTPMSQTVNGVSTDWRVAKAVADLVRTKNPTGKILVMEGSTVPAATAFSLMGYTKDNFGTSVDEFIGFEGASCSDRSTDALVQKTGVNGKLFWVNKRYANADVVISLPTMKTHLNAGITGAVKNLGIGTTPAGQYAQVVDGGAGIDCTRGQTSDFIDHSTPETLGQFIHDYYSLRPADFVVMDALQGLSHGPASMWSAGGNYATDQMNMRLILAGRNAVAVDTIEALVMKCDPKLVPHLTKLEADGLGTTDTAKISVVGKQVSDVAKAFTVTNQTTICPGQ
jgi:uncharacterized protein (DUF362 family)